jgi:hypothetical protein
VVDGRSREVSGGASALSAVRRPDGRTAADPFEFVWTGDSERGLRVVGETEPSLRCAMLAV